MTGPGAALVDQSTGVPTFSFPTAVCSICARRVPVDRMRYDTCFDCLLEENEANPRHELARRELLP